MLAIILSVWLLTHHTNNGMDLPNAEQAWSEGNRFQKCDIQMSNHIRPGTVSSIKWHYTDTRTDTQKWRSTVMAIRHVMRSHFRVHDSGPETLIACVGWRDDGARLQRRQGAGLSVWGLGRRWRWSAHNPSSSHTLTRSLIQESLSRLSVTRIEKTLVNIDSVLSQSRSLIQKLTNFIQKDCLVEVAFESSVVLVISGEYSCVCVCYSRATSSLLRCSGFGWVRLNESPWKHATTNNRQAILSNFLELSFERNFALKVLRIRRF